MSHLNAGLPNCSNSCQEECLVKCLPVRRAFRNSICTKIGIRSLKPTPRGLYSLPYGSGLMGRPKKPLHNAYTYTYYLCVYKCIRAPKVVEQQYMQKCFKAPLCEQQPSGANLWTGGRTGHFKQWDLSPGGSFCRRNGATATGFQALRRLGPP